MKRDRRLAGVGGIAFVVSLVAAFTLFGPKGGRYSAAEIDTFVAQSSTGLIVSIYLFVVSMLGLFVLMAYLSEACFDAHRYGRVRCRRRSPAAPAVGYRTALPGR